MRDIELLNQKIQSAEKHLSASEQARNRECEALMEMWRQIRTRFNEQEAEIARYRGNLEQMIQENEALCRMIDHLLGSIEGNVERARDETVPKITSLAEELMASEPASIQPEEEISAAEQDDDDFAFEDTGSEFAADEPVAMDIPDIAEPISSGSIPDPDVVQSVLDQLAAERGGMTDPEAEDDSMSAGIRDLISRVETMSAGETPTPAPEPAPGDELARELREIETLRDELSGLRQRISTGS